jgi:hypothetical protein
LLAPGTQGSFEIVLENTSEVTAQYKVVFDKSKMPGNFIYSYKVNGVEKTADQLNVFTPIDMKGTVTITVNWTWPIGNDINYETETSSDNQYQGQDLVMGVTVTVEQVD